MTQQISPFLEGKFGWDFGENNWNTGMDENINKFSFMTEGLVNGLVTSLPPAVDGEAYFLTTDNRFYYVIDGVYQSSPCPIHFIFKERATGDFYQFDGASAILVDKPNQLREELANSDGTDLIGYADRLLTEKLSDIVSPKDYGAIADGASHPLSERYATLAEAQAVYPHAASLTEEIDWAAMQSAVNTSRLVFLSVGHYVINKTVVSTAAGQKIIGSGQQLTTVEATHITGAAFRFQGQYPGISSMTITASSARTSAAYTSNGFGVHFEGPDIPDDPLLTRMRNIHASDLVIFGQTGAAIYAVGPVTDGSSIDRCRIFGNNGHGIALDRGQLGGRVNLATIPPGVMNINNCAGGGNTGHIVALGHPTDTNTTATIRVVVNNFDVNCAAMVQAVLYNPSRKHAFWVSGSNHVIEHCVVSGSGTETAIFVQGTQNHIRNLRQIEIAHAVEVGDNVPTLYTDGVFIDGANVINVVAQTYAVVLANAPNARNILINIKYDSDITALVDTYSVMGLEIEQAPLIRRKSAVQTVNNSTALVDITDMSYYLKPGERARFVATLYYQAANTTGDIKFALRGPALPVAVFYGPLGNIKVGTADIVEVSGPATAYATNIAYGANSNVRVAVIEGYVENGSTAGLMALRFAQLVADPTDTSILPGSTLTVFGNLS